MKHEKDSLSFPPLALGTWTFAGDKIWSNSDDKESIRVIHAAIDEGITLFDTSPNYGGGRSEQILGKALQDRSMASVATKIKVDGKTTKEITLAVEQSLHNLKREAIDLMQIHWPATTEDTAKALDCFINLKNQGKIINIGVCNFGTYDLKETENYPIKSNQLPYNLFWRVIEDKIAPSSKEHGMKVWVYSPFQQGLLSGKYKNISNFPEGRMRTRHFSPEREAAGHGDEGMERETQEALTGFLNIAKEVDICPLELGLRYISSRSFVDTILVGARTVEQLKEIRKSLKGSLDNDVINSLNRCSEKLLAAAKGNPDMYQKISRIRYQ